MEWPRLVLSLALSPSKGQSKGWGIEIATSLEIIAAIAGQVWVIV
jgi:hypothetical protein